MNIIRLNRSHLFLFDEVSVVFFNEYIPPLLVPRRDSETLNDDQADRRPYAEKPPGAVVLFFAFSRLILVWQNDNADMIE
jgi:hypothetical protein